MGPVTRSQSRLGDTGRPPSPGSSSSVKEEDQSSADTKCLDLSLSMAQLSNVLQDLEDLATVVGKDAKLLRDSAVRAISDVRQEAAATTSHLAREIRDGNTALLSGLNASFEAVDARMRALPAVASFSPEGTIRISPFSGFGDGIQFSSWLRRFEDVLRMRVVSLSSEQKANLLIAHLEGIAREKVEDLPEEERKSFDVVVNHLRTFFEGPHQRNLARQALASCKQVPGEASTIFANRILEVVRAAMAGQDNSALKERVLEEFVKGLRPDLRYFVKLEEPPSFEQAVRRAQTIEQLLLEATADRLMHPAGQPLGADVSAAYPQTRGHITSALADHCRSTYNEPHEHTEQ
ncbi:unnamed protein product [Nippostrongylus brasiliensis]|uniref:Retrotransposon gag domain-containing protein n=1 Tax=Nippostrongylus brasiliensis TaxID=27835 RepID=A0A0N4YAX8_NIPBR|nr:unnamed protein product [Nippostrongylus brasiliensis]